MRHVRAHSQSDSSCRRALKQGGLSMSLEHDLESTNHTRTGEPGATVELSRRTFLKSAATVSGGLVIAMYLPGCGKPENAGKAAGPLKLIDANAWLRIGTDGSV